MEEEQSQHANATNGQTLHFTVLIPSIGRMAKMEERRFSLKLRLGYVP